jgi:predicted nucleic acid-binding protein
LAQRGREIIDNYLQNQAREDDPLWDLIGMAEGEGKATRIDHRTAVRFIDRIQASQLVQMLYLEPHHINEALTLFRNRPDKGWSVTDCTSFVAMQLKGLDTAFALDEHFRQAGFRLYPKVSCPLTAKSK